MTSGCQGLCRLRRAFGNSGGESGRLELVLQLLQQLFVGGVIIVPCKLRRLHASVAY